MNVFRITKPHIYARFRTSIILKNHAFLKKVGHKVGHKNMHESVHACIKAQKNRRIAPAMQLKIVGFHKLTLCWFLINSISLYVDMNDWPDRCETAIAVVLVSLQFGGMMMLNGASNSTID